MREMGASSCCYGLHPAPGILAFPKLVASVNLGCRLTVG